MFQKILSTPFVIAPSSCLVSCQPRHFTQPDKHQEIKPFVNSFQTLDLNKEILFSKTKYQISAQAKIPTVNGPFENGLSEICSGQAVMHIYYPTYRISFENIEVRCSYYMINSARILPWQPQPIDGRVYTKDNRSSDDINEQLPETKSKIYYCLA